MANAISYMKNVGKSVTYSAIDSMKKMNPVVTSFYETNSDIFKETYRAIKDIKGTTKDVYSKTIESEVGGLAKGYFRNLMEDAKSGKFYNRERINQYQNEAVTAAMGDDDFDFDFNFDDDIEITLDDDTPSTASSGVTVNDLDSIAEKSSIAMGQMMARTAQYQVEAQRQSTKVLYDQNAAIFGKMHSSIGAMNSNIGMIINYLKENTNTHYDNSRKFYENTTNMLSETNAMLKEMLEIQRKQSKIMDKSYSRSDRIQYSDIFTSDGALDIKAYIDLIKQNAKDNSSGMVDSLKDVLTPEMMKTFISSPLQGISDAAVKLITPKLMKDAFREFNQSLAGFFSSAVTKLGYIGENDYGIMGTIGKYLGFRKNLKGNIDTSSYQKGAVPFDGVTRKAIIDVIPTYLAKIYSSLSGTKESRYNYETGQFVTVDTLKNELKNIFDQSSRSAAYDIMREFESMKKAVNLKGGEEQSKQFDADMKKLFDYYFRNAKIFDRKLGAKDYGMTSKYSEENLKIMLKFWEKLPKSLRLQFANNINEARDSYNRRIENIESDSMSPLISLFNGSMNEELATVTTGKTTKGAAQQGKKKKAKNPTRYTKNRKRKTKDNSATTTIDENKLNSILKDNYDNYYSWTEDRTTLEEMTLNLLEDPVGRRINKVTNKPATLFSSILNKIDDHLYTFIFGDEEFDKDADSNGMLNAIFHKISESFDKFNLWLEDNIFLPVKTRFTKENVRDAAMRFFGMFGIDLDSMVKKTKEFLFGNEKNSSKGVLGGLGKDIKQSFKDVGLYIKNSFLDIGNYFGVFGKKNARGEYKSKIHKRLGRELAQDSINRRKQNKQNDGVGETEPVGNAAEGISRVSKTGVVAVSEGELIIPPDMNPFNIRKRYKEENKAKKVFLENIPNFAEGGTVFSDDKRKKKEDFYKKTKLNRSDYEELHLGYKVLDELKGLVEALKGVKNDLFSSEKPKDKKESGFTNAIDDVMQKIRAYAPDMIVGSTLGAGVSLITGAIGGPLLGAASGAAISLIKNSEQVQKWLFGEIKNGERQGGLINKELSNNINKYFPDMGKGAVVGAITSILPFVPGGPVAGIILGSSIGFAKNNEEIQRSLFGEEGLLGPEFPDKVKKVLPKMGAGALVGLIGGPFGVATNIMLGSAIGFATDTEAFKNAVFGEPDADGKRSGGILEAMKESIVEPNKQFFGEMFKEFKDWFNTDIKDNFKRFMEPAAQDLKNAGRDFFRFLKRKANDLFDKFIQTRLGQSIEKVFGGINKKFQSITSGVFNIGKSVISAPFKVAGHYGDFRRTRQIKSGRADMMTAAERLDFRNTKAFKKRNDAFYNKKDNFLGFDTTLNDASDEEILGLLTSWNTAKNTEKSIRKEQNQAFKDIKSLEQIQGVDNKTYKKIVRAVKTGNLDQANKAIDKLSLEYEDKDGNKRTLDKDKLKKTVELSTKKYQDAEALKYNPNAKQDAMKRLKDAGIDLTKIDFDKVGDYLKAEVKGRGIGSNAYEEGAARTIQEQMDANQERRHQEIVQLLKQILGEEVKSNDAIDADEKIKDASKNKIDDISSLLESQADKFTEEAKDEFNNTDAKTKVSLKDRFSNGINKIKNSKFGQFMSDYVERSQYAYLTPFSSGSGKPIEQDEEENVKYEMYQGKAIKYVKTKDNGYTPDKGDSETVEAINDIKEDKDTQKGILASLTSMPGKILSFFGKKDGDKEDKKEGVFSKLLKGIIGAGALGALIAFSPKIADWFKENVLPIATEFIDGFKAGWNGLPEMFDNGAGKIGQLVGDKVHDGMSFIGDSLLKAKDWMLGEGEYQGEGLPKLFNETILPNVLDGFEFLMAKVAPKIAEIMVGVLPLVIKGAIKGLGAFFKNIWNGGDDKLERNEGNGNNKVEIQTITTSKPSGLNWSPKSNWSVNAININSDGETSTINGGITNTTDENGNRTISVTPIDSSYVTKDSNRRFKSNKSIDKSLPKAFSYLPKNQQKKALESYNKVKDEIVNVDGYGSLSIEELLNRDDIVVDVATDSDGNLMNITGADILSFPETAAKFGIDSSISNEEGRNEFLKDNYGVAGTGASKTTKGKIAEAMTRAFVLKKGIGKTGLGLANKFIKSGAKTMAKAPRNPIMAASRLVRGTAKTVVGVGIGATNMGINAAGYLGSKVLPTTAERQLKAASDMKEAVDTLTQNKTIKRAADKIQNLAEKFDSKRSTGIIKKVITKVDDGIKKLFENNKIVSLVSNKIGTKAAVVKNALKEIGEKIARKITEKLGKTAAGRAAGKLMTKLTTFLANPIVSIIATAVIDFISGWNDADIILNISEPSIAQRLVTAIVHTLNGTFCFGLIPEETLFEWIFKIMENIPILNGVAESIREKQAQTEADKEQYELEHGVTLTTDEYLEIKNHKIRTAFKNAKNKIAGAGKAVGGAVVSVGKKAINGALNVGGKVATLITGKEPTEEDKNKEPLERAKEVLGVAVKNEIDGVKNFGPNLIKSIKTIFNNIGKGKAPHENFVIPNMNDDSLGILGSTVQNSIAHVVAPISMISFAGHKVLDGVQSVAKTFRTTAADFNKEHEYTKSFLEKTSLTNYWILKNKKSTGISSILTKIVAYVEKVLSFPITFINVMLNKIITPITKKIDSIKKVGGGLWDKIKSLFSGSSSTTTTATTTATNTTSTSTTEQSDTSTNTTNDSDSNNSDLVDITHSNDNRTITLAEAVTGVDPSLYESATGEGSGLLNKVRNMITGSGSKVPEQYENRMERRYGTKQNENSGTFKGESLNTRKKVVQPSTEDPYRHKRSKDYTTTSDFRRMKQDQQFVSQVDNNLSNTRFNIKQDTSIQTVKEAGCAPAVATMAINIANKNGLTNSRQTFSKSISNALNYKAADEGVTADYFINEFSNSGMSTAFISSNSKVDMKDSIVNFLKNDRPVVLMGSDGENSSKKNSPFGPNGHYVLATGISDDGQYVYINDPESKTPNIKYKIDDLMNGVSLGIAPVEKNRALDAKTRNSRIVSFMKKYRASGLTGSSNREKIWNFLRGKGCSEQCAAAIIGNLMQEASTSVDPTTKQYPSGPGRGIVQWEYGSDRWNGLMSLCNSMGVDWTNLEAQCLFMWQEIQSEATWKYKLKSGYSATPSEFLKWTDIEKATKAFCTCFERAGIAEMSKRINYAKTTYEEFSGKTVPADSGDGLTAVGNVNFHKYTDATDDIIRGIAAVSIREQGTDPEGYMAEASLICNKSELKGGTTAADLKNMVLTSWFGDSEGLFNAGTGVTDEIFNNVKALLVEGKRTLPAYVDEHDCNYSQDYDISSATNNGVPFDFLDRSKWQPMVTRYRNKYQSSGDKDFYFYGFPNIDKRPTDCDVFGYTSEENRQKYGDGHYDINGNAIGSTNGTVSGTETVVEEPAWKNPKSILDIYTIFDDLAKAYGLVSAGTTTTTSGSLGSSGGTATGATVSDAEKAELQKKMAESFIKSEKNIPTYSQSQSGRYDYTIADDGTITGNSADCSSLTQGVYKKFLNVDPGGWTGDMLKSNNTYTVEKGTGQPGSAPTASNLQLGDLVIYGPSPDGQHVELYTGDNKTMGHGSAPGPHYCNDCAVGSDGKLTSWFSENQGFNEIRRWTGFKGAGSGLLSNNKKSKLSKIVSKSRKTPFKKVFSGKGSGLSGKASNIITSNYENRQKISRKSMLNDVFGDKTSAGTDIYEYAVSTGSDVYASVNNTSNNVVASNNSNSEELIVMLKAIVKILVRLVDNSENMKQIVSLLTQLVTVVSTTNTDNKQSTTEKAATATTLKANLINAINNASQSNPDKELIDIINSMEALASL